MKVMMRLFLFSLLFFFYTTPIFTQSAAQPWWLTLEQGKLRYRSGQYGDALMLFEDARRNRRAMYEQMERDFINLLSINEVRRLGDSLDWVVRYSSDRYYFAATAALEELFYRIPITSLNNSAAAALEAIGRLKDYPEAEYWIGEIYRVEGELSLALYQYRKAYIMRDQFEDPGFAVELLYKIANILLLRQEYNEMERTLLSIIGDLDTLWKDASQADAALIQAGTTDMSLLVPYAQASASFAVQAMTRTLDNNGVIRFLELYRYDNKVVEPAHRNLGIFYALTGRPSAQQHLMFAFLIQNTTIIEEIKSQQFDFSFNNLPELAGEIRKSVILTSYVKEVEYYKTVYYFAASLFRNGRPATAGSLWTFLAALPEAGEWQNRSIVQLRSPHLEPLVEMP